MMENKIFSLTHRRFNLLTGEWVLVAPGRLKRPWQGRVERVPSPSLPEYDPSCYLCPGNTRASGERNPSYASTFVFDNDFSSLAHDTAEMSFDSEGILRAQTEQGVCRVICFSPRHDLTLAEMSTRAISDVVRVWQEEYKSLGALNDVSYVQIFENKGELMGCSNPHPHCQVWAQKSIPVEPSKELGQFDGFRRERGKCLLCSYVDVEMKNGERVVYENRLFVALVPFWAVWPFEVMVLPKNHMPDISFLGAEGVEQFADILREVTVRYDNLFEVSFPYSSGIHQSPTDGMQGGSFHFHMHFYPPLLRSASVRKFMVGYEMLANPQRDFTPELAAERLRALSGRHFRQR